MERSNRGVLRTGCSLLVGVALVACQPRGETRSVDEVLSLAADQYAAARSALSSSALSEERARDIRTTELLIADVAGLAQGVEVRQACSRAGEQLRKLIPHAGYPSRPAAEELARQYVECGDSESASDTDRGAARKLLAARTYNLLTAELQGARFGL